MNKLWNVVINLVELNDEELWKLFAFYEIIGVIFSIGVTAIIGWLVGLIVGMAPYASELFLGWLIIYLVVERWFIVEVLADWIEAFKGEWKI